MCSSSHELSYILGILLKKIIVKLWWSRVEYKQTVFSSPFRYGKKPLKVVDFLEYGFQFRFYNKLQDLEVIGIHK
ncbi:hypothetical protein RCL_jg765.t1 [Rhizophagus clarus]|uniref:Uncharacterized protein n=1 Tax=Rhizophagus clarus TaxID=94130 RepID=A0A8H3L8P1_9GLOM|nr:hypothetical protein RCL_jg765.t1 [Rhizophagus clarus]